MNKKIDYSKHIEFAKLSLERNDESIRFSDSKSGFIFTFASLFITILSTDLIPYKKLFLSDCIIQIGAISSMVFIVLGALIVIVSTIMVVLPRLQVSRDTSYIYIGTIHNTNQSDFHTGFKKITDEEMLANILSQVHATSYILAKKYYFIRFEILGTVSILVGWIIRIGLTWIAL